MSPTSPPSTHARARNKTASPTSEICRAANRERPRLRESKGLDRRRGTILHRRRDQRRRVRQPSRLPAPDERVEAAAAVPGARDVRGIAARTRNDRDRLRAEAARAGGRAGVLLPGGPRADARHPRSTSHAASRRSPTNSSARRPGTHLRRDAAKAAGGHVTGGRVFGYDNVSFCSAPVRSRTSPGSSMRRRPRSSGRFSTATRAAGATHASRRR